MHRFWLDRANLHAGRLVAVIAKGRDISIFQVGKGPLQDQGVLITGPVNVGWFVMGYKSFPPGFQVIAGCKNIVDSCIVFPGRFLQGQLAVVTGTPGGFAGLNTRIKIINMLFYGPDIGAGSH